MLNIFRRGIVSKLMLVVLGIGLFAIVITGFGTDGMGGLGGIGRTNAATLAEVGDRQVTATEAQDAARRQLERLRQEQPTLELPAFLRGGAFEEIVRQLVIQKAILGFGDEQGLGASKRMVDGEIASIPAFRNLAGTFDAATFRLALQREGISEAQLREDIRGSLIQRQLILPAAGNAVVPDAVAERYASLLLEQRTGSLGSVPAAAMGAGAPPTAAEVARFYRDNEARYTLPERRVLRYAEFGLDTVLPQVRVSDQEIAANYQANQATYGPKQNRTLSQVVLPTEAAARQLVQRVAGGATFAAAAQAAGFAASDTRVGDQTEADFARLASPAVARAAFGAAEGAITQPIRSEFGWHVVRVDSINQTPGRPLAEVRGEIEGQLRQQKAQDALSALVTRIEDRIGDGATLAEAAAAEKLAVRETPALTAGGVQYDDPNYRAPELRPLLRSAFEMSTDDDPVVEPMVPNQRFALLSVARVIPAAAPPLAGREDKVRADLIARRARDRARAVGAAIVAKINSGTPPARAFAEAGVRLPAPETLSARRIDIARPGQAVPTPLTVLFSLPPGRAKLIPAEDGSGWNVVHLARSVPGDARSNRELVEATRISFQRITGEEYAAQFARALERHVGVERNPDAIRAARQALLTGGPAPQ